MTTLNDIIDELRLSGISFQIDFDSSTIRMFRDKVHEKSLTTDYPTIEEKFFTKGTYNLGADVEKSLLKAMKYFSYDSGKHSHLYQEHWNRVEKT